jgi:hypothetical protein
VCVCPIQNAVRCRAPPAAAALQRCAVAGCCLLWLCAPAATSLCVSAISTRHAPARPPRDLEKKCASHTPTPQPCRRRAWAPYIQEGRLPSEHKLKDMVRLGVPPTLRPWVWMEASGAAAKRTACSPSYYTSMALAGEKESPHLKQIDQVGQGGEWELAEPVSLPCSLDNGQPSAAAAGKRAFGCVGSTLCCLHGAFEDSQRGSSFACDPCMSSGRMQVQPAPIVAACTSRCKAVAWLCLHTSTQPCSGQGGASLLPLHLAPAQDGKCAFPNHPWLQSEEGQTALRRVLAASSLHNPKVGYTRCAQGREGPAAALTPLR